MQDTFSTAIDHRRTQVRRPCRHCGTLFTSHDEERFCCRGCETVYGIIHQRGLDQYYQLRESAPPSCPLPVQSSDESFAYCDDPELIQRMTSDPERRRMTFFVEGLNCTACFWLLEHLPRFCPDASSAHVNMSEATVTVTRTEQGSFAAIARALDRFGYRPHPISDHSREADAATLQRKELRRDLVRVGVAGAATGNIMILAVSIYAGASGRLAEEFRFLSAAIATPVLSYCAWPFYKSALAAVRTRHLNLDVPIVFALFAGIAMSAWSLITRQEGTYFDSLSMLVFLLLASRLWLKNLQKRYLQTSRLEDELLLGTVKRLTASGSVSVSSLALKPGDEIEIDGEQLIPADGTVTSGTALVQTSVLTGESEAHELVPGAQVEAGSRNLGPRWSMKVERPAASSRLAQILRETEASLNAKPQLLRFADHVSEWFIAAVILACLALVIGFFPIDPHQGLMRALALAIVTCPCVFGMAIPLSLSLAVRAAAQRGIVIRNADAFERLWSVRKLYFDKTGTLTEGAMRVLCTTIADRDRHHLSALLALESGQPHPVAKALLRALQESGIAAPTKAVAHLRPLPGGGLAGEIDAHLYSISPVEGHDNGQGQDRGDDYEVKETAAQIRARYGFYCDGVLVATFDLGDRLRPEAASVIAWAKKSHLKISILSGDRPSIVESCARQLGIDERDVAASVSPEGKAELLKDGASQSAMIGDGANDAAALAAAGVGLAVRGAMDVSLKAADVYLMRADLLLIPELMTIARRTRVAIRRNLIFSATFNLLSGTLAALGLMTPLWAAVLMPLSSLTVLVSALASGRKLERSAR